LDKIHIASPGNIFRHGHGHGRRAGRGVPNTGAPDSEEQNLDDLVGGTAMREPEKAKIAGEGSADDGDITGTVGRTKADQSTSGLSKSSTQGKHRRSIRAPVVATSGMQGTEDTALGRGIMAPQTVLLAPPRQGLGRGQQQQQPYMGTAPMRLSNEQETDEDTVVAGKSSSEGDHSPTSKRGFGSKFGFGKKDPEKDQDTH
jgi:hypothetical protein